MTKEASKMSNTPNGSISTISLGTPVSQAADHQPDALNLPGTVIPLNLPLDPFCGYEFHNVNLLIEALDITPVIATGIDTAPHNTYLASVGAAAITIALDRQAAKYASEDPEIEPALSTLLSSDASLAALPKAPEIGRNIIMDHAVLANRVMPFTPSQFPGKAVFETKCKIFGFVAPTENMLANAVRAIIGAVAQDSQHSSDVIEKVLTELGVRFPLC